METEKGEILSERGVFSTLNSYLISRGMKANGMFWATGLLAALHSPFINNITSAMIFGKSIKEISRNHQYQHIALCNLIITSNSGVWFLGTATSLMVVLAGKISIIGLLTLFPAGIIGWAASAAALHIFYIRRLSGELIDSTPDEVKIKRGGTNVMLLAQLQKVEWNTLLFFIGIISGVAALNHVGWLPYISRLFEVFSPTTVNVALGVISGVLDNVPVEAAALMVGVGGSLTVIGSAAGIMVMSIDKSYSFGTHLKFLPAILTNFFVSLGVW